MEENYLSLDDLLARNMTAFEYFQTLAPEEQQALQREEITTFQELQQSANEWKTINPKGN